MLNCEEKVRFSKQGSRFFWAILGGVVHHLKKEIFMDPLRLPTYVDEPHQFLLWSADEIIPLLTLFVLGVMFEQICIFTFVGFLLTSFYKKYKNSRPDGFLLHGLYWAGLLPARARCFVNPFIRRFFP
ncbi:MAG: type IV conjugative transfer system protein TraL [Desulfuromonas thiophila]|nr:type IV conjugative transfer system protein TraL [Desulfuromonas thiophila]